MTILTEQELLMMPKETYMNQAQLQFFEQQLIEQKRATMLEIDEAKKILSSPPTSNDEVDHAHYAEESALVIRMLDRKRRLLPKIDKALTKIRLGNFGYCEETGEPIGLKRLLIRPTAEFCIDAKELREGQEIHFQKFR